MRAPLGLPTGVLDRGRAGLGRAALLAFPPGAATRTLESSGVCSAAGSAAVLGLARRLRFGVGLGVGLARFGLAGLDSVIAAAIPGRARRAAVGLGAQRRKDLARRAS